MGSAIAELCMKDKRDRRAGGMQAESVPSRWCNEAVIVTVGLGNGRGVDGGEVGSPISV